jgi:hypothetical protein
MYPLEATAGFFDKDYTCKNAADALADYDRTKYEDIFSTAAGEAMSRVHDYHGGEEKFRSKAKGREPLVTQGLVELGLVNNGTMKLCNPELGYKGESLISDFIVNMFNGKHDKIRDEIKKSRQKEFDEKLALYNQEKSVIVTKIKLELEQKCLSSIRQVRPGYYTATDSFNEDYEIDSPQVGNKTESVKIECFSLNMVKDKIALLERQFNEKREEQDRIEREKREQEVALSNCKSALEHSQRMSNYYKAKDFFKKRDCPSIIPEEFSAYKKQLLSHKLKDRFLNEAIESWESENIGSISENASNFLKWMKSNSQG